MCFRVVYSRVHLGFLGNPEASFNYYVLHFPTAYLKFNNNLILFAAIRYCFVLFYTVGPVLSIEIIVMKKIDIPF